MIVNSLETLGINQNIIERFRGNSDLIRKIGNTAFTIQSPVFHPDTPNTGNSATFLELTDAKDRINTLELLECIQDLMKSPRERVESTKRGLGIDETLRENNVLDEKLELALSFLLQSQHFHMPKRLIVKNELGEKKDVFRDTNYMEYYSEIGNVIMESVRAFSGNRLKPNDQELLVGAIIGNLNSNKDTYTAINLYDEIEMTLTKDGKLPERSAIYKKAGEIILEGLNKGLAKHKELFSQFIKEAKISSQKAKDSKRSDNFEQCLIDLAAELSTEIKVFGREVVSEGVYNALQNEAAELEDNFSYSNFYIDENGDLIKERLTSEELLFPTDYLHRTLGPGKYIVNSHIGKSRQIETGDENLKETEDLLIRETGLKVNYGKKRIIGSLKISNLQELLGGTASKGDLSAQKGLSLDFLIKNISLFLPTKLSKPNNRTGAINFGIILMYDFDKKRVFPVGSMVDYYSDDNPLPLNH